MFSIIGLVVEALLTSMAGVGRWSIILFIVFSCDVLLGGLACKSVCCTLDMKSQQIADEWTLGFSSDFS